MEVQDHNLLVVSLDNCISTGSNVGKTGNCIYTAAMSGGACNHDSSVVELASPVQCLGTMPRLQQHLTQLQPIQYSQTVSYEPAQPLHQHTNLVTSHAIYQSMSTAPLHHYTPTQTIINNTAYLNTASAPSQTIHLAAAPTLTAPPPLPSISSHHHHHQPPAPPHHQIPHVIQPQPVSEPQPVPHSTELQTTETEIQITPEPTFPEDDCEYYKEIQNFLTADKFPDGVSDNYKKHLRKRAQHYVILDGKLYHSRKQPKEVVMKKEDQQTMLKDIHVIRETGVHLGVKKMFGKLQMKYFWRGMYIDVVTFVKNCEKCSDVVDMARQKQGTSEENEEDIDNPAAVVQHTVATQCSETMKVWKKVEVWMHGPLRQASGSRQEFLVTVADHESRWVVACPVTSTDTVVQVADFLVHTFCSYGFPQCCLVGFNTEMKDRLSDELRWRTKNITDIKLKLIETSSATCLWVTKLVNDLVQTYSDWDLHLNHFLFQYRTGQLKTFSPPYGCTPFSALFNHDPLSIMDNEENKENIDEDCSSVSKKKKLQNTTLKCEHCNDVFTSKISFRIHQRRHMENRLDSGDNCESRPRFRRGVKKKIIRRGDPKTSEELNVTENHSNETDFKPPEACVESTVSAVKALLAATKEERRRRGKYHKYTPELQEHMASYAVKHGNQEAVRYFSERLGIVVSESTIRNLVKVHSSFTPVLKDEIGRFAANFGVEPAARYFSNRLKRVVPQNLVRKFKVIHLEKLPDTSKRQKDKKCKEIKKKFVKKPVDLNMGKGKRYTSKIKEEIGYYACQHSVSETAKHFSEKLQVAVKERTIRRFHKAYVEQYQQVQPNVTVNQQLPNDVQNSVETIVPINMNLHHTQPQPPTIYATPFAPQQRNTSTTTCLPPPTIPLYPPLNQCSENNCYQPPSSSSVIMTQTNGSFHYQSINSIQNFQTSQPFSTIGSVTSHQSVPAITPNEPQQDQSSFVMTQQPLIVSHEPNNVNISTHFMVAPQPDNSSSEIGIQQRSLQDKSVQKHVNDQSNILFIAVKCTDNDNVQYNFNGDNFSSQNAQNVSVETDNVMPTSQPQELPMVEPKQISKHNISDKNDTSEVDNEEEPLIKRLISVQNKKEKSKKDETSKKRGRYTAYSPELRAEIGKYAAEHSSLKACQYFGKLLGHDVPESTARGLKEKYLRKKLHCTVTSLGYSQRGRPLRLGKYDEVVQECLKELVRSGEKVSSFLAITTAKQILNKCDPGLLEDNGGPIKLNTTWAKSFLKRIGVHNNS